ncbi:TonB-linked SusC/RagA family outer membrane protein [Pseudobacter ginsenosidimutans]|uniref:TonB-linked SusC/RagA family outer membrane protein n=2 Tax=Pseudobacter ginsenosidimutans TaxID=661488 RepID=A0A4Q7MQ68_9BACT|nr:SusC/RagA family TonB-linked outer membrane protein [Pseudobacter ginsenosidimutans]RZS70835.1 TonB-linked SusC/RagA family outer membrane protein [Pseudobacter ginsenosidimutans]
MQLNALRKGRDNTRFLTSAKKQLLMRLTFVGILLLGLCLHISAKSNSQTITFSGKKASLKEVFTAIEKQTGFVVFYDGAILRKAAPVSIQADKMPLLAFLDNVLKEQLFDYSIQKKTIVISAKRITPPVFQIYPPTIEVRGRITTESGEPASGVTVTVKGTDKGTATNGKGEFTLEGVNEQAVLIVSSVNFETQEVKVNGKNNILIVVKTKVSSLGDVTVSVNTGYQKIPKERATGSYSVITAKDLERRTSPDLINLIEGMAPGLLISRSANGIEGEDDPSILMRGVSTFGNQQPLIVVDGFPIEGSLSTINPNDVETITLLRDAAAAAIWGVKATNGVIVINTKKGKTLSPKVTFRSSFNINPRPKLSYLNMLSPAEMVEFEKEDFYAFPNNLPARDDYSYSRDAYTPVYATLFDFEEGKITAEERDRRLKEIGSYDNLKEAGREFFNNYYSTDNTVSISAAPTDRFSYYASFGYVKGTNLYKGDEFRKTNVNFNSDIKLTSKLTLAINANYSVNDQDVSALKRFGGSSNSVVPGSVKILPYERLRNPDGSPRQIPYRWNDDLSRQFVDAGFPSLTYAPLDNLTDYDFNNKTNNLRLQSTLSYKFNNSIALSVSYKSENIDELKKDIYNANSFEARNLVASYATLDGTLPVFNIPKGGILSETRNTTRNFYVRAQLDLNHTFNHDHRVDMTLGLERQKSLFDNSMDSRFGYDPSNNLNFPVDFRYITTVGVENPVSTLFSKFEYENYFKKSTLDDRYIFYYFAGSYAYKGKYTFSTSARINKSSRFDRSAGLNKQILASAGLKWDLLRESFIKAPSWMNLLQLRYTAGLTGNVPDLTSSSLRTIAQAWSSFNLNNTHLNINSPANRELRWEPTFTHNLALDFSFLSNRISGSVDFYHKKTTDLLASQTWDPTRTGFYLINLNTSDITNKGVELRLNTININNSKFRWQTTVNLGLNTNKVGYTNLNNGSLAGFPRNFTGFPSRTFFAYQWAGVDETGAGLMWDVQADGKRVKIPAAQYSNLKYEDLVVIGSIVPKYTAGLTNILQYGNWDLSFLFIANGGHFMATDMLDEFYFSNSFNGEGYTNISRVAASRWQKPGDEQHTQIPRKSVMQSNQYNWSDQKFASAAFIKLREVAVAYLFDKRMLGAWPVNSIKLNFQVRNAWKWVKNKNGIDPEAHLMESGERTLPITPTYTFGVLANF